MLSCLIFGHENLCPVACLDYEPETLCLSLFLKKQVSEARLIEDWAVAFSVGKFANQSICSSIQTQLLHSILKVAFFLVANFYVLVLAPLQHRVDYCECIVNAILV